MLTIDDINSIHEKYGVSDFFYRITKEDIENSSQLDFIDVEYNSRYDRYYFKMNINLSGYYYGKNKNTGEITKINIALTGGKWYLYDVTPFFEQSDLYIHISGNSKITFRGPRPPRFIPLNELSILVIDGKVVPKKIYIHRFGEESVIRIGSCSANRETNKLKTVEVLRDEKGEYINAELTDLTLNYFMVMAPGFYDDDFVGRVVNIKSLPIHSIHYIYKGNTQTIKLMNDTEEITEFQAYYKGELLTDNKITLPYDADDYIDITVDLLDNRYPNSTLKLKAPTQMYIANSQSDVETAISQGITTLQVGDTETEVLLNNIELSNITLVDSNIQLTNSTLNNCTILNSQYTDNGANTITNTVIRNTDYTNTSKSTYEDTSFYNSRIQDSELQITGTIYECELTNSLIISDGTININNNTFTGIGSKTYFPSHLYLTGDYIVSGNTFNLTGTFTELSFNMCLIKAPNDFNVGEFINKNTFQLNIEYETEPTSTLYYNIVDDDKIRARRI